MSAFRSNNMTRFKLITARGLLIMGSRGPNCCDNGYRHSAQWDRIVATCKHFGGGLQKYILHQQKNQFPKGNEYNSLLEIKLCT